MYKKILLGLLLSALVAASATAQSSSKYKGSSSRSNSTASEGSATRTSSATAANTAKRKMEREANRQHLKMARQIAKSDFAAIKLTKDQLNSLKQSVAANYQDIQNLDNSIGSLIPKDKRKGLIKSYKMSMKDGLPQDKAMTMSMQDVGISEMSQEKVMDFNTKKMDIMDTIKAAVKASLTPKQSEALAASMAEEEMMAKDKSMSEDKMMSKDASMTDDKMGLTEEMKMMKK